MPRRRTPQPPILLRSAALLDVDTGELVEPGELLDRGRAHRRRRADLGARRRRGDRPRRPDAAARASWTWRSTCCSAGPTTRSPLNAVQDDPALRTLRAVANARRTLRAGFTTVRNLGLFIQTGGLLLDVALMKAIDFGWIDGPRVVPGRSRDLARPAGTSTRRCSRRSRRTSCRSRSRRASPTASARCARRCATRSSTARKLIKVCASGGVMSHTGPAGAQQYSDEELAAIADEAHRAGLKVAAHAHGDDGIRAAIEAGIDCIEHGSLATDETLDLMVERGTFLVADHVPRRRHGRVARRARAAGQGGRGVPAGAGRRSARRSSAGVKIACGTDAPAIPHGRNAKELIALVERGMTPLQAIRAATTVAARAHRRRRPRPPRARAARRRHRRARRPARRHHRHRAGPVRDEGRRGLPQRRRPCVDRHDGVSSARGMTPASTSACRSRASKPSSASTSSVWAPTSAPAQRIRPGRARQARHHPGHRHVAAEDGVVHTLDHPPCPVLRIVEHVRRAVDQAVRHRGRLERLVDRVEVERAASTPRRARRPRPSGSRARRASRSAGRWRARADPLPRRAG